MVIQASPRVAALVRRYNKLQEEIHSARRTFAQMAEALVNPITVRLRADAPPGYGTTYDMSKTKLPNLKELGQKICEWQSIRAQLISILEDPATDKQSVLFLDSKLHVRVMGSGHKHTVSEGGCG